MTTRVVPLFCGGLIVILIAIMSSMEWARIALLALSLVSFAGFLTSAKLAFLSFPGFVNSIIFLLYSVITVMFYTANYFTGEGITFDVITQFNPDSLSAGFYAFETYHKVSLILLLLFAVIYFMVRYGPRGRRPYVPHWGYVVTIMLMFTLHPFVTSTAHLFYRLNNSESSEMVLELIDSNRLSGMEIQAANSGSRKLPNVLMIYLESLERTYFDDRYYENLLTGLQALTDQGQDFTNVTMPWGATHTIAGIVASLCGVPINTPRGGKHQSGGSDVYMPQAQCLGDITRKLGYYNVFYQGARLSFSSKGGFMRAHGYDEVKGLDELKDDHVPRSSIGGPWGLHDDVLLGKVEKRLDELLNTESGKPFFFTMLTLDTHDSFGENRYSRWCGREGVDNYIDADHKIQHAVYCSDKLMSKFIERTRKKWRKDLLVVMMSDHAAYPFNVGKNLRTADNRNHRNLLLTFFEHGKKPVKHLRSLSSLDLGATVLGYITDNKLNTIGLGVNGFDVSRMNLVEQLGGSGLDLVLQSSNLDLGKKLWKMPSFAESEIEVDVNSKSVTIESNRYAIPVALMLDESGGIIDFYGKDAHQKIALLKVSPRLVWIGQCKYINAMYKVSGKDGDICLVVGNLANKDYHSSIITGSTTLKYEDLSSYLDSIPGSLEKDLTNRRLYRNTGPGNTFDAVEISQSGAAGEFAIIDINSTMNVQANLVHYTPFPTMEERLNLKRREVNQYGYPNDNGLYLLEVSDGKVNVRYHWKTCSGDRDFLSINTLLKKYKKSSALVLTSAREVKCKGDNLRPYFENSPFELAASLDRFQPYIAYLENNATVPVSVTSQPGDNVQLRLVNRKLFQKR